MFIIPQHKEFHVPSQINSSLPVTTAWRFLGLRIEERHQDVEGSCEYIE